MQRVACFVKQAILGPENGPHSLEACSTEHGRLDMLRIQAYCCMSRSAGIGVLCGAAQGWGLERGTDGRSASSAGGNAKISQPTPCPVVIILRMGHCASLRRLLVFFQQARRRRALPLPESCTLPQRTRRHASAKCHHCYGGASADHLSSCALHHTGQSWAAWSTPQARQSFPSVEQGNMRTP